MQRLATHSVLPLLPRAAASTAISATKPHGASIPMTEDCHQLFIENVSPNESKKEGKWSQR